ncbi:hypothetical protein F4781DRAFT_9715 [Annulohypoxylon bovei var. microspora]|nr:hypothetical protein F4781DRAFT_9715 [Annulohypoxylon bovei var. microspora]
MCIAISGQPAYASREDHVQQLEDRLSKIESERRDPATTTTPLRSLPATDHISNEDELPVSSLASTNDLYQGSSSFTTLSAEASKALQTSAISKTSDVAHKFGQSFSQLDGLIRISSTSSSLRDHRFSPFPDTQPTPSIKPLPVNLVVSVLQKIKAHGAIFLHGYIISDISLIDDLCRRVFFPTDPVSIGLVTGVHGLLCMLLRESLTLDDPLGKEYDLKTYITQCEHNFNVGIETYDILAIPSFENVFSLTLLDEVVETLQNIQKAGRSFERLYEICATFARLSRRMVEATNTCVGVYTQGTDSLQLFDTTGQMPGDWLEPFQDPDLMSDAFPNGCDSDISTIFTGWMNGQLSTTDILGVNFEGNQQ